MWVCVAFQAIVQAKMGTTLMTSATRRDDLCGAGGVADMAIQASNFVAMSHAVPLNGGDDHWMAFDAIAERRCCYRLFVSWFDDGFVGCEAREVQANEQ